MFGKTEDSSIERLVVPADIFVLIAKADRLVVTQGPFADSALLFESSDRSDLDAFAAASVVERPGDYFHCMCVGSPAIHIYRGSHVLAVITNHHGASIRCSLWDSDAPLVDPERWLTWFDDRHITEPREEVEWSVRRGDEIRAARSRWLSAVPKGLREICENIEFLNVGGDLRGLREALDLSIPDREAQIHALLAWFGSGLGPWSGFPSYETVAEAMLFEYDTSEIVAAMDVARMPPAELEGAARLFSGWNFSQVRPGDLELVPEQIKAALFAHVKDTNDDDKYRWALKAFVKASVE